MTPQEQDDVVKQIWEDVQLAKTLAQAPELLAHYTSMEVLEKILQSKTFMFSSPHFMSDIEEVWVGMQEATTLVAESVELQRILAKLPDAWEQFRASYAQNLYHHWGTGFESCYVFCLSEFSAASHDGKLSMWRAYGRNGNGSAIVIDLQKLSFVQNSPMQFGKVRYMNLADRRAAIQNAINNFCVALGSRDVSSIDIPTAATILFQRLAFEALYTKHEGFAEEQEWRAAYWGSIFRNEELERGLTYVSTSRGIEPRLALPLSGVPGVFSNENGLESIVRALVIGPSASAHISEIGINHMLDKLELRTLKGRIRRPSIPFRAA